MTTKNLSRHNARRYAVQALYQWYFNETNPEEIIRQFTEEADHHEVDMVYFKDLVTGTIQHIAMIDELMITRLDRGIKNLNPVELSILRLAVYELVHCKDIPYKVVINEALELTKEFGAKEGYKYVNGVLDAIAPKIRS
ncbi:transcription antitermination factor NusB [Candidiatus Paracoxiella cheracis]|uniref:transcription antitermination factor NusB n=1 Tax=Candidiatus Paracoxiella cheracis TaxID=3405120 RepID=UPI003BF4DDAD